MLGSKKNTAEDDQDMSPKGRTKEEDSSHKTSRRMTSPPDGDSRSTKRTELPFGPTIHPSSRPPSPLGFIIMVSLPSWCIIIEKRAVAIATPAGSRRWKTMNRGKFRCKWGQEDAETCDWGGLHLIRLSKASDKTSKFLQWHRQGPELRRGPEFWE